MTPMQASHVLAPYTDERNHLIAAISLVDIRVQWAVERASQSGLDPRDEFRGLYISDEYIEQILKFNIGQHQWASSPAEGMHSNGYSQWANRINKARTDWQARTRASQEAGVFLPLNHLIHTFALTMTETEAFLLALAPEIDPRYAQIFAYLQDDVTLKRPSIDLLLNLLTDNFPQKLEMRVLFGNNGRLVQKQLLQIDENNNKGLLAQFVRPYAHIVEYLVGDQQISEQLSDCVQIQPVECQRKPKRVSTDFLAQLKRTNCHYDGFYPFYAFVGKYGCGRLEAAQYLAANQQQPLFIVDLKILVEKKGKQHDLVYALLRDGQLYQATLFLLHWDLLLQDGQPEPAIFADLLDYPHPVIVAVESKWQPVNHLNKRPIFTIDFPDADYTTRLQIWQRHLGHIPDLPLESVANHFRFTPGQIENTVATAYDFARWRNEQVTLEDLFIACRQHSNQNLQNLATKIHVRYTWNDIVLPADTLNQLQEMVNTIHRRPTVYGQWGFDKKLALGKGLSALFAGESGTGKTMSADIISGELGLDLYKIDLSTVISKYIGETEKNLDRIFTEAATSNAILFFDEADAIFGKRSEVKDSHDRYANIEISYLLQRMEMYDGVVILATNLRGNLDEAFTRRLHFAIEFPFPEENERERIWQVNFPAETPIASDIDFNLLATRYPLAGGNIRNIILAAAFLAAEVDEQVGMKHLFHATRREYQKIGRLIDEKLFK